MHTIAKPLRRPMRMPHLNFSRWFNGARRRRQATIDLIHSSPHLLRDIGAVEQHIVVRRR